MKRVIGLLAGAILVTQATGRVRLAEPNVSAESDVIKVAECEKCPMRMRFAADGQSATINVSRLKDDKPSEAELARRLEAMKARAKMLLIKPDANVGARTRPMMGWSSWNTFGFKISEEVIVGVAKAMATNGLKAAGYRYVNIDDGMFSGRDAEGNLRFHPVRFPNGMKGVVDTIHSLGLKAGTYSDGGSNTCASIWLGDKDGLGTGLYGHDARDFKLFFNDLKFDFIKVDYCSGYRMKLDPEKRFTELRQAIDATGRTDVRLTICHGRFNGPWVASVGDSWRMSHDIRANWEYVRHIINRNLYLSAYPSPGHYNDMDMLEAGQLKGQVKTAFGDLDPGITPEEEVTHFGTWCLLSSPLILGCDPRTMPAASLALVTNPYLLAMNQNELGLQAYVAWTDKDPLKGAYVLVKDADKKYGTARYVGLVNLSDEPREITMKARDLDLGGTIAILDLVERADIGTFTDSFTITVPPHGSKFYRLDAETRLDREIYEAESAWMGDFHYILGKDGDIPQGPQPKACAAASGGVRVEGLGGKETRDLTWKNVYVSEAGEYDLLINCFGQKNPFYLQLDGGEKILLKGATAGDCARVTVKLSAGEHTVRLSNQTASLPPIDYLKVIRKTTGGEAAALQTFLTPSLAAGKITCDNPCGWTFDVSSSVDAGRDVVTIRLSSPVESVPPQFGVLLRVSGANVRNVWTCDYTRDAFKLSPQIWWNWTAKNTSHLAKDVPLAVGFGPNEISPVAFACSEAFNFLEFGLYTDERTCETVVRCEFFKEPTPACKSYEVKILLDRRGVKWYDVVRDAAAWIGKVNGFQAAHVPEAAYEPLYSTWYAYLQEVQDQALEKEARHAAQVGMKTMVLDDGWQKENSLSFYSACGDWMPAKSRFPDMKGHVANVQKAGLKYLLWMHVPIMGSEAKNRARFEKMTLKEGGSILDPRFPEVREYLISTCERVVGEWGFDGMKLDFIDEFQLSHPDPALKDNYIGRDYKSLPQAVDRLMRDILARLQKIKPDVLIEFRQHYMGPAILQYGNMIRACDCPNDMTTNRRRICDLRLTSGKTAVHSDMLVWSRDETPEGAALPILNVLFSAIQYSMVLDTVRDEHKAVIRHWIDFTTRHRETLLKGAFRPHHPENGYTWIEAESAKERIIAVYSPSTCASCGPTNKPVIVVNATATDQVLLEFAAAPKKIELFDVFGKSVGTTNPPAGLTRLPIPQSGTAKIIW